MGMLALRMERLYGGSHCYLIFIVYCNEVDALIYIYNVILVVAL